MDFKEIKYGKNVVEVTHVEGQCVAHNVSLGNDMEIEPKLISMVNPKQTRCI